MRCVLENHCFRMRFHLRPPKVHPIGGTLGTGENHKAKKISLSAFFSILALGLLLSATCHAEGGCPPGQYPQQGPGWQTCVPIPGADEGSSRARWIDAWGAFAADMNKGILGISTDERTEAAAKLKAMSDCMTQGGSSCKVTTYVRNGCMAMAVGSKLAITDQAATRDEVEAKTMATCTSEDSNCQIYKSVCIAARRIP